MIHVAMPAPTAVVIDDSRVTRRTLGAAIERADFHVVGEGASGDELLGLYEQHRPTVVFIDMVMPGKDGLTAAIELLRVHPRALVVMCSASNARDKIVACVRAGISSYLLKPFDEEAVAKTLRRVLERVQGPGALAEG